MTLTYIGALDACVQDCGTWLYTPKTVCQIYSKCFKEISPIIFRSSHFIATVYIIIVITLLYYFITKWLFYQSKLMWTLHCSAYHYITVYRFNLHLPLHDCSTRVLKESSSKMQHHGETTLTFYIFETGPTLHSYHATQNR